MPTPTTPPHRPALRYAPIVIDAPTHPASHTPGDAPGHTAPGPDAEGLRGGPLLPGRGVIITIDGPAATGKSSTARELARRLGLQLLNTGRMYRAAAALTIDLGIDPRDAEAVVAAVDRAQLRFDWSQAEPPITAVMPRGGEGAGGGGGVGRVDITPRLQAPDVDGLVSPIAQLPALRRLMIALQQRIAQEHPRLVTEGRDQGSAVFPGAAVKFYVWASAQVRAARRAAQNRASGLPADERAILAEIESRDARDRARPDSPLCVPVGAIVVDTSALSFDQAVGHLERTARHRLGSCAGAGSSAG
ncbi:MAG: (d)CMP kinase [Planctomyces sp.]|nr:(d)CMP kinase [Planctomyces sp.]MBA4039356.1 (d)CMP kinase [Planctomyces sp.]